MSFSLRDRLCSSGRSPSSELGQARRRLLPLRFFFIVTPFYRVAFTLWVCGGVYGSGMEVCVCVWGGAREGR